MTNAARRSSTRGYSSEVKAIIAASPSKVTAYRAKALESFITYTKSIGVWQKLDVLWIPTGAESEGNLAINLKSPGNYTLTKVGAVAHHPFYGVKGDGTTGYYNTNWIPGTNGVNYQTNSSHVGSLEFSNVASTSDPTLSVIGTGRISLVPRTGGGQYTSALNANTTSGATGGTSSTSVGHTCVTRTADAVSTYKDGSLSSAWSHTAPTSTAVVVQTLFLLAINNSGTPTSFSSRFLGAWHAGGYLTPEENASLYLALSVYIAKMRSRESHASSVSWNGIPVGSDTTGIGAPSNPWLTLDQANTSAGTNEIIVLNGSPSSPTVYTAATTLALTNKSVQPSSGNPLGAKIRATSTTTEVIGVNPGNNGVAKIGAIIVDGQNVNPECIELSNTPTVLYDLHMEGTKVQDATLYGIWSSSVPAFARVTLTNCTFALTAARACIVFFGGTGARLDISGGTYSITNANLSGNGGIYVTSNVPDVSFTMRDNTTVDVTIDAAFVGSSVTAVRLDNVQASITGAAITVDGTAANKVCQGITLRPTNDAFAQDMGGFVVRDTTINITTFAGSSAAGVWVGWDGASEGDESNGLLNGGIIDNVTVTGGGPDSQVGGFHGIAVSSHADTEVTNCTVDTVGIGFVLKASSPHVDGCTAIDCTSSYFLLKGSRPGTIVENSRSTSTAGNAGPHISGHVNDIVPPYDCAGTIVRNNNCVNDGAIGVIFVDIAAGQDITLTGNNYFNRSGTLDALPFRYHGTSYATFAAYQAAVEPTATNVDPDL